MKIAYFTGMYPIKEAPHGGIFITKRIEALMRTEHNHLLYAISINDSMVIRLLRKIFHRGYIDNNTDETAITAPESEVIYSVIKVKLGIIDKLLNKITGYKHQVNKTYRILKKELGKIECDVIHTHWLYPTGAAVQRFAKYCNKPHIITCHGSDVNILMGNNSMRKHILPTLEEADSVEFVSTALKEKAVSFGYSGGNSIIIPNGIEKVPGSVIKVKDKKIIGYVGNLISVKRADKLPDIIMNIINNTEEEIEFYIIGDGELKSSLEERLNFDDNIKFLGRIPHDDVLKKMQQMDVLMLPSRNEGWPCVVLEAYSCGIPVVGSTNGGIPEAINDERLLVGEENFEINFSKKVIDVINNDIFIDNIALIDRAKEYVWDSLLIMTIENYKSIANQKGLKHEKT